MTRRQKDPLRSLSIEEREQLEQLSRAQKEPAIHVVRAQVLLAVANGLSYTDAAQSVGRRSGDAVSHLVLRFNQEGIAALEPRHGGGAQRKYGREERQVIVQTLTSPPDPAQEGTLSWSLSTLQRHLQQQEAFATISTYTLWQILHESNWSWQESRSWLETGKVKRRRKGDMVEVTDPDGEAKKS